MKSAFVTICLLAATALGCAGSDFAGGGATKQQDGAKKASPEPSGDPEAAEKEEAGGEGLGTNQGDDFGPVGTSGDGTIQQPKEEGEKIVVFGGDKVFHLGDDDFADSTCMVDISFHQLSGKTFNFEFEVIEDATSVDIVIDLCGVDIVDTNFASLRDATGKLQEHRLVPSAYDSRFQKQTLAKGKYLVVVESRNGTLDRQWSVTDFDDYIVKQVLINSNKGIRKGQVTAY